MSQSLVVDGESLDARDKIPIALKYGQVENCSITQMQKFRAPDSGATTYTPGTSMQFYLETGGAQFLNGNELYMTYTFTPTLTNTAVANVTNQVALDYNTDAIIRKSTLQINGTVVEELNELNRFCNLIDFMENQDEKYTIPCCTAVGVAGVATAQFSCDNLDPDNIWFGQSIYMPRQGMPMRSATAYQHALHIKSFVIGKWSKQFFPLAFVNQLNLTLLLENAANCLKNVSYYNTAGGGFVVGATSNAQTWDYTLTNIRLHYTVTNLLDDIGKQIQRAYLSNGLPDILHASRFFQFQKINVFASQTTQLLYTLSGTAFDTLIFQIFRETDYNTIDAATLSNYPGGLQTVQLTVNGQKIPFNKIDTSSHAYEMYRQMAYAYGKCRYKNSAINFIATTPAVDSVSADYENFLLTGAAANSDYTTISTYNATPASRPQLAHTNGYRQTDSWNAPVLLTDIGSVKGQQGCTLLVFPLRDKAILEDINLNAATAIRGKNVQLDLQFLAAPTTPISVNLFALQNTILTFKGTSVAVIS